MGNLISLNLEATKITDSKIVDDFIANTSTDFCKLEKIHKKSGYGCNLSFDKKTIEEINNSEQFRFILDKMTELNFKAHNAKNNYMYISYYFDEDTARNILNKVDLFVIGSHIFCQRFARKDKSFKFNFYEKTYCDLGTTTYENAPIAWNHCDHCAKFVFFRSTLKFQTIMASIEFVKTLFDFVSNEKITYDELYEDFRSVFEKYINFACKHSLYFEEYLKTKFDLKIIKEYV